MLAFREPDNWRLPLPPGQKRSASKKDGAAESVATIRPKFTLDFSEDVGEYFEDMPENCDEVCDWKCEILFK